MHPRRYYLLKARAARHLEDDGLARAWLAKHDAMPGTPLPDDFPSRQVLIAAGYTAAEDVDGITITELLDLGLSLKEADAVLRALCAL